MLDAAESGRVGERYIISDKYMSSREIQTIAAEAVGVRPPRIGIPLKLIYLVTRVSGNSGQRPRRPPAAG